MEEKRLKEWPLICMYVSIPGWCCKALNLLVLQVCSTVYPEKSSAAAFYRSFPVFVITACTV